MTHQVHALPWSTLCSNFRYRKARSGTGPQYADLYPRDDKPDLLKSIEHFARSFQTNLRLHTETHRRKHHTAEQYARRARSWKTSTPDTIQSTPASDGITQPLQDSTVQSPDEIRRQRNLELRSLQASLEQDWSVHPETRTVYPDYFHASYSPHMDKPLLETLQCIENWPAEPDPQPAIWSSWPRALFEQCEVVKTLFIAAAELPGEAESQRNHLIDTLFLLAYRPETLFRRYNGLGLSCCYFETGLDGFIKRITRCYVYLNMLFLYHEQAGGPSRSPSEQPAKHDNSTTRQHGRHDADSRALAEMFTYHTTPDPCHEVSGNAFGLCRNATPLSPWPAYARLHSYRTLTYSCCHRHEYTAEAALLVPFFFPLAPDFGPERKYVEADILTDPERLKTLVRKLWRVLVIYEMVNNDRGLLELQEQREAENLQPRQEAGVNWEYVVLDVFSCLWAPREIKMIFGMGFGEYVDRRRVEDPVRGFQLREMGRDA